MKPLLILLLMLVSLSLPAQEQTQKQKPFRIRAGIHVLGFSTSPDPNYKNPHYASLEYIGWTYPVQSVPNGEFADFKNLVSFGPSLSYMQLFVSKWGGSTEAFRYTHDGTESVQIYRNPTYLCIGLEPIFFAWKFNLNAGGGIAFVSRDTVKTRPILKARISIDNFLSPTISIWNNPIDQEIGYGIGVVAKF